MAYLPARNDFHRGVLWTEQMEAKPLNLDYFLEMGALHRLKSAQRDILGKDIQLR